MRDELHLMELVDRYLDGSMNDADRTAFEARASGNAEMRQLIEDQRALREGVARIALRKVIVKSAPAGGKGWFGPALGGAALIVVATCAWMKWLPNEHPQEVEQPDTLSASIQPAAEGTDSVRHSIVGDRVVRTDTQVIVKRLVIPPGTSKARQQAMIDSMHATVTHRVVIASEADPQNGGLVLQNVLTPDGDLVNDRLIIPGGPYRRATLSVFSMNGELIYESSGQDPSWDGRMSDRRTANAGFYNVLATAVDRNGGMLLGRERVRLQWPDKGKDPPLAY